jgi:YVTN family beta-propeller protein
MKGSGVCSVLAVAVAAVGCATSHPPASAPQVSVGQSPVPLTLRTLRPKPTPLDVYADTHGPLSAVVAADESLVYVPNSVSSTVTVIDPHTFTVVKTFRAGLRPQHITPAWDLRTLYIDDTSGNTLIPIDPRTAQPGAPIQVDDPYNLYFTPDGTKAIVVAERNKTLDIRSPGSWALRARIRMPCRGVNHGDFTADGSFFLVSCEWSGKLIKVDLGSLSVASVLELGGRPIDVRLSSDGKVMYVTNESASFGGVQLVDPSRMRLLGFLRTGAGAHGEIPSRDGRSLYVTNRLAHSVSVIDFARRKVVRTWIIPNGSPDMGGVSADGRQLWLSGRYGREVYVVDTDTGNLLARIRVGVGPHGLCLFPQPGRYSLGHTGNYR